MQIAVYGKGGIGKSTISANLSYQLAGRGHRVAQIGCDPKHDSTRLLLGGRTQSTILASIESGHKDASSVVAVGSNGVVCMEAGGPEPGVGCAGRGILTAFDFIESNGIAPDADIVLYDVLGDVVCGGFAVPLRRKYADAVFIVTSGEFMSLYAANNILKGVRNYDGTSKRMGGLILNSRGNDGERQYVANFADAVGLPIVAEVPRDVVFSQAESEGRTVSEKDPNSRAARAIGEAVDRIEALIAGDAELYEARPLDDATLDLVAKGIRVPKGGQAPIRTRDPNVCRSRALTGCGVRGAFYAFMGVEDTDVIIHGPNSCLSMFATGMDYMRWTRGELNRRPLDARSFCTGLKDISAIYGGMRPLVELIETRIEAGSRVIFVATACVPGIIGDDVPGVCRDAEARHPGVRVIPCICDGVLNGGWVDCHVMAVRVLAEEVDQSVEPVPGTVNIIGYGPPGDPSVRRLDDARRLIGMLGLDVNCLFLCGSTFDDVRKLRRGCINVLAEESSTDRLDAGILQDLCGIPFFPDPLPRGISATRNWMRRFGERMGVPRKTVEMAVSEMDSEYERLSAPLKDIMKGKRVMLHVPVSLDIGWVIEIADLMGMEILEIECSTISIWNHSRTANGLEGRFRVNAGVERDQMADRIVALKPDIILGAHRYLSTYGVPYLAIGSGVAGYRGCLDTAERIANVCRLGGLRWTPATTDSSALPSPRRASWTGRP